MKQKFLYLFLLIPILQGCVANSQTGQMEPGWLFWVFLGLLLGGVFIGALASLMRKKKTGNDPSKSEQEIAEYEETLNKKLNEKSDKNEEDN